MKNQIPRLLMIVAIYFLWLVFSEPLWSIVLEAAQFPEPLELYIWVDKISGNEKHILQNVNILNHYIGMKPIEPDSIPELQYFPKIIYGLMGLGLIATIYNKAHGYLIWFIIVCVLGILGIYDFYTWLYDYGHDLDPKAAIKIPGQSYQPPLYGERDLLNFYVSSYPAWGAIYFGISSFLALICFYIKYKISKKKV